jgi:hypothetical protein
MLRSIVVVAAIAAYFLGTVAAWAQARPTQAQLSQMTGDALADPDTITFARPQVLGFKGAVVTHQLGFEVGDVNYYFAVTKPRLPDGLIFFTYRPSRKLYRMHRTDTHLRRVASAQNDMNNRSGLTAWAGAEADADLAAQLAYWAGRR